MKREDFLPELCRDSAEPPRQSGQPGGLLAFLANRVNMAIHAGSLLPECVRRRTGRRRRQTTDAAKQSPVSTGQLKTSLSLHLRPINHVVYMGALSREGVES